MLSGKVVREQVKRYPELLKKVNAQFLPTAASVLQSEAKRRAPVKDGLLKNSISSKVKGDEAAVFTNVEYAPYVEYGTRPHTITVKNAKVLSNGKQIFGTKANHPGTKAQPFMRPALDAQRMKLIVRFRKIFARVYGK